MASRLILASIVLSVLAPAQEPKPLRERALDMLHAALRGKARTPRWKGS